MFDVTCLDAYGNVVTNLTQWDTDQSLIITDSDLTVAPEFHFCNKNSKEALKVSSTIKDEKITVKIPNILLQEGVTIIAYMYAYTSTTSGKTLTTIRIPVRPRPKPSDYKYVENIEYVSAVALEQSIAKELKKLSDNYEEALANIDDKYAESIELLFSKIADGTPNGVFTDESDLIGLEPGIYINSTDCWIYFWDGTTLSEGICQYQTVEIPDSSITNDHLGEIVSIEKGGTGASEAVQALYNLGALPYKEIFFDEIDRLEYRNPISFYQWGDNEGYNNAPFAHATILSVESASVSIGATGKDLQIAISHDDGSMYIRTANWIDSLTDGLLQTAWTKINNTSNEQNHAYLATLQSMYNEVIEPSPEEWFKVEIDNDNNTATWVGMNSKKYQDFATVKQLVIPYQFQGAILKTIGNGTECMGWDIPELTAVKLPNCVTEISQKAFKDAAENLENINIPLSCTKIGYEAFSTCSKLKTVEVSDLNQNFTIGERCFDQCVLTNINPLLEKIETLPAKSFSFHLTQNIIIPENIVQIEREALTNTHEEWFRYSVTILNPNCEIHKHAFTNNKLTLIKGYKGSTAETFANTYNIPFVSIEGTEVLDKQPSDFIIHAEYVDSDDTNPSIRTNSTFAELSEAYNNGRNIRVLLGNINLSMSSSNPINFTFSCIYNGKEIIVTCDEWNNWLCEHIVHIDLIKSEIQSKENELIEVLDEVLNQQENHSDTMWLPPIEVNPNNPDIGFEI